ncbi:hypothetical protein DL240_19260 [Lujinxingia litoralis]|uniref:Uncharacterized protein n=1 Tax=Lujinxingia litoralis TaxID=2211119 RepID=A0A328C2H8_9DELT|nr:hypothetical protein [Lujinxingia litoralis]RAL19991.1 hypothetical protein DL240_19260 [Lujinxingia litoralis]
MSETKFDITLRSWMERSAERLRSVSAESTHPFAGPALKLAVELLEHSLPPYRQAIDRVAAEGEDAARAAEEIARAEDRIDQAYLRLWATAQSRYFSARAAPGVDETLLKRRLERGLPLSPSVFSSLGVDRARSHMKGALIYATDALGVDDPALTEALQALDHLDQALTRTDREKAQAVRATQLIFEARQQARQAYTAARQIVEAALALEDDESLRQLMPAVGSLYHTTSAPARSSVPPEPTQA